MDIPPWISKETVERHRTPMQHALLASGEKINMELSDYIDYRRWRDSKPPRNYHISGPLVEEEEPESDEKKPGHDDNHSQDKKECKGTH